MRKLIVRLLAMQCTVVKGSLLSAMLVLFSPIFGFVFLAMWMEDWLKKVINPRLNKILNSLIRFPGSSIIEEAGEACSVNIGKYERFLGIAN